jgi:rhodanese-related sulfurtransferase
LIDSAGRLDRKAQADEEKSRRSAMKTRSWMVWLPIFLASAVAMAAAAQHHAPIAAGAPETAAQKLFQELGQGRKILMIDVREPKEFEAGHVSGAINIPLEDLSQRLAEMKVPKDTTIVTMCEHGGRSSRAALELQKLGYKTSSFCRLDSWKKEGHGLEKGEKKSPPTARVYRFYCQHSCLSYVETADLAQICEHCNCSKPYHECMKKG